MQGRIGASVVYARHDSRELTKAARAAFLARFLDEVDPDRTLPEAERARRAEHARRAYMALRSAHAGPTHLLVRDVLVRAIPNRRQARGAMAIAGLMTHFAALEDPRVERTKLHPLASILAIAILAVISGAEGGNELALTGCLITGDAIGCQRAIATQIVDGGADDVRARKGNQGTLAADVGESFARAEASAFADVAHTRARTVDKAHGRLEMRQHTVIIDPDELAWLQRSHTWPHLAAIRRVESERRLSSTREQETRSYLLSRPLAAAAFGAAVRAH